MHSATNIKPLLIIFFLSMNYYIYGTNKLFFGNDFIHNPSTPSTAALYINSSNTIIDLDGNAIMQDPSNNQIGIHGIEIAPNISNVTIRNGVIKNFTGNGIYIGDGCNEIYINNITINNCLEGGILFDGSLSGTMISNGAIIDCIVTSCNGTNGSPAFGLRMNASQIIRVKNCLFNNNDAVATSSGYGVYMYYCNDCTLADCSMFQNGGGTLSAGIALINSSVCRLINCLSASTIAHDPSLSGTAFGFLIEGSISNEFTACKAIDSTNQIGDAIGFSTSNGFGNSYIACTAQNTNSNSLTIGFYITGTEQNSAILNSQSVANVSNILTGTTYGILIDGPQNCSLVENVASGNIGAIGIGLRDTTTNTNNYIAGTLSYANTTTGYDVFRTAGSFPVRFANIGNFTTIEDISKYMNVAIV